MITVKEKSVFWFTLKLTTKIPTVPSLPSKLTLRKLAVFGVILDRIFRIRTEYGVSLRIQSKCRKMRTRITPTMDTFHAKVRELHLERAINNCHFLLLHLNNRISSEVFPEQNYSKHFGPLQRKKVWWSLV